jgi:(R,R)-butanediol dehydrogenase/meso-butanediol dehydrogenase/diacetyl reductase
VFARVIDLIDNGAYPTAGWVDHIGLDGVTNVLPDLRAGRHMKILVDLS